MTAMMSAMTAIVRVFMRRCSPPVDATAASLPLLGRAVPTRIREEAGAFLL
ncbi:MAG: hypothetical protein AVDCRST_MAG30-3008 [uncultured Solirubrobacteraceae bacterium]|uniref:Uncharacterized protein n=1 Tax=uncultured Solirubrobacteraceae bacterium TaxID=1162706 RepID=A0A6J4TE45_9ACTN|nr:MAG: hypothetical protein AVDCRST_MAG30-3008 [uncultured Solirubrobacteraceae bacterium]